MDAPIAAIATAPGKAAIGLIRLSGQGVIQALSQVFRPLNGRKFGSGEPQRLVLGTLLDRDGQPLDQAMAVFSRAPRSYTGEDTCEVHCHGSPALLTLALESLFAQGVRQAGPGEFTRRAFLNGKLDLLQAESVADLIDAQSPQAACCAASQLSGALSRRVGEIYDGLLDLTAHFHAALDYPDEDLDPCDHAVIAAALDTARRRLTALLATYGRGKYVKEGVPTAIVGPPNGGKSTLLNLLCGFERAIVTDVPGTTRDTVEETCLLGGVLLRLTDTAGIRETSDPVEKLGVERSRQTMEEAGLILAVLDSSRPPAQEDLELVRRAAQLAPTLLIRTKGDLPQAPPPRDPSLPPALTLSALGDPEGAAALLGERVAALFPPGEEGDGQLLTNLRQAECARRALEAVDRAQAALEGGITPDFLLTDVEEALSALGELTGADVREDTVERIFSRFCVGK